MPLRPHLPTPRSFTDITGLYLRSSVRTHRIPAPHCSTFAARPSSTRTSKPRSHIEPRRLHSSLTLTALGAGAVLVATAYFAWESTTYSISPVTEDPPKRPLTDPSATGPVDPLAMPVPGNPPDQIPPGRPGALTKEEETKLKEFWVEVGKLTGQYSENARVSLDESSSHLASGTATPDDASTGPSSGKKKRRFFGRSKKEDDDSGAGEDLADKHGSNKEFQAALQNMTAAELRDSLWGFCKGDDPDANLCRYLRARKWNVHDALVMLVSTIHWRARDMKLDEDIMRHGEEAAMMAGEGQKEGTEVMSQKLGADMITQLKMGKSYVHGVDKTGRPICFIQARLHKGGQFSEESLERLTVYMIETTRFMLRPPVDTATLIFDMTGFTLANMDYTPVKFMIKVFEANYPESLGTVLVHKAPWVFQSIWSIIRGWLDPVVASKINFTKDAADLEKYVDLRNIPKDLGGQEDFKYEYVPPRAGENVQMQDQTARAEVQEERNVLLKEFEQNTEDWAMGNRPETEVKAQRAKISQQLHLNYWRLDPFIRSRSMYDRIGVLQEGGKVDMYPPENWSSQQKRVQIDGTGDTDKGKEKANGAVPASSGGKAVRDSADAKSMKSVYYDAQDDID